MNANKPYFGYWAKTNTTTPSEPSCHLLPYHSLDVAAVADVYLSLNKPLRIELAHRLHLEPDKFQKFFVYCLALHDIGKFARSFQGLVELPGIALVSPDPRYRYGLRHDALGLLYWQYAWGRLRDSGGCRIPAGEDLRRSHARSLDLWMGSVFGHHGKPVDGEANETIEFAFKPDDLESAWQFMNDAAELLEPIWPLDKLGDKHWRRDVLAWGSWQLAGLAVLTDWLGSDQAVFGYQLEAMPLPEYWHEWARPRGWEVLERSGLIQTKRVAGFPGFRETHGFDPTPLQSWAEGVSITDGPQLFFLEDITGSGKTEAALTLAHRLLSQGCGDGLYFALPTMATSNAMYHRVGAFHRQMFSANSSPSLVLAHGARQLNETFNRSILSEPRADRPYHPDDPGGLIQCTQWLADNRKRALLADVGVGTVDQALLALLPRKHQSLRLFGLARKVLVIDEVHAYDTYTSDLLQRLLEGHAQQGGSAILLSATIPHTLRQALVASWQRGLDGTPRRGVDDDAFPLATHVDRAAVTEVPIQAREANCRELPVRFVHDEETTLEVVVSAAREGCCVCWIRNTVDDAIDAFDRVQERMDGDGRALLFHARFAMGDRQRIEEEALSTFGRYSNAGQRQGCVLVSTQVVEQSLDLDFDVLVSDLAPIELLIQRAGRLHRHARDVHGNPLPGGASDQRAAPLLHVLAPEWTDRPSARWLTGLLRGTGYVYRDTSKLWLTCKVLRRLGAIRMPCDARLLLESVYGPDVEAPEELQQANNESHAERQTHRSAANFNALDLSRGYCTGSARGAWNDDEDVGTRLTDEPTVQVVLLREEDPGVPYPWIRDAAHPWAMSAVHLRQSLADRLPSVPDRLAAGLEELRERHPGLRFARFWLPDRSNQQGASLCYDAVYGVRKPRGGGERRD